MDTPQKPNDEAIRPQWERRVLPPLAFIMGLHRSGTTFLYESVADLFPVAKLTVSDVVNFDNLITNHVADGGRAQRDALAEYFSDRQATNRGRDALPLSPSTAEEYGWILKRNSGSYRTTETNLPLLRDVVCKLAHVHSDAEAVLLKNPWDTGNAPYLARCFPEARFVFICREPMEILNSELANALHFSGMPDALLTLLTREIRSTKLSLMAARWLRRALGTRMFSRLALRLLTADIVSKLAAYRAAIAVLPSDRVIEVCYADLAAHPQQVLADIGCFLDLPPSRKAESISAARRSTGMLPLVRRHEGQLSERLVRAGLTTIRSGA